MKGILYQLYIKEEKTLRQISDELNLTVGQVRGRLRRYGIRKTKLKLGNKPYDNREWLYDEYVVKEKGYSKIADEQGTSYMTILERLIYFNIDIRTHNDIDKGLPNRGKKRTDKTKEKIRKTRVKKGSYVTCELCSNNFYKSLSNIKKSKTGKHFCNWECYKTYLDNNRKVYDLMEIRKSADYKEWRLKVYKRDNYRCKMPDCKDTTNRNINAHHIYPLNEYPQKAFDVDNGIVLCVDCHKKVNGKEFQYIDLLVRIVLEIDDKKTG